jgi:hypothetical protein
VQLLINHTCLFAQVVTNLGLTVPGVEAMVSWEEGQGFQPVTRHKEAGSHPAGSTAITGKRAAPEPAAGVELQVRCWAALLLAAIIPFLCCNRTPDWWP